MKIQSAVSTKTTESNVIDLTTFQTETVSLQGKTNGQGRATLAARIGQGKTLVSKHVAFINRLGITYAQQLVAGGELDFGQAGKLTLAQPSTVSCTICGQIHGDKDRPSNEGQWNVSRLALSPLFVIDGKIRVISESCTADYVLPVATPETVSNLDKLRASFSRFLADRAKRAGKGRKA